MARPTDLVTAKKALDEPEAIRVKAFLEGQGIDCEIFPYHTSAFDGLMLSPREWHWGEIRVLARDLERAKQSIADIESSPMDDATET